MQMTEFLEDLLLKVEILKSGIEKKGLCVNTGRQGTNLVWKESLCCLSSLQEWVEMQSSVVPACCECIRNRAVSRALFAQTTRYGRLVENCMMM